MESTIAPKGVEDNLKYRIAFNQRCDEFEESRKSAIKMFMDDPIEFFSHCLFTYDPRKDLSDCPFILYDYQENFVRDINSDIINGEDSLTEKTRDMGVTWMILGVFVYRWLMFDENFLAGSRKEELVDKIGNMDSHFERMRYMIKHLPPWMIKYYQVNIRNQSYMKIFKDNGASIIGESMNQNFSRQGRYKAILLDEFAFVEQAESIWTACGDSAPCKIVVSTPHGNMNKFARLRKSGQIKIYTLHWKLHPEKDEKWYSKQQTKRSERDVAQELDINYTLSAGTPYYNGFRRSLHVRNLTPNPEAELILGWDYGWHHPACVITQNVRRWSILDCLFGEKELIRDFGNKVKEFLNLHFPGYKIRSFGDPAGNQESDKSLQTSVQILSEVGFEVFSQPSNLNTTNYDARQNIIEGKLKTLIDGAPALLVNDIPRTQIIIEAFEGGWHYPEPNKFGYLKERPVRDGYFEHVMNALEYIAVNVFSALQEPKDRSQVTIKTVGDLKDIRIEIEEETVNRERYIRTTQPALIDD